jgi:hypothetical protein
LLAKFSWIWLFLGIFLLAWYGRGLDPDVIEAQGHYGWLSLLPAVAALAICFITRNVILALFTGIILAGAITGQYNIIEHYLLPSLGTRRYAEILLIYLWALGGLLGIWNRNGGALHFANYVSQNFVKSRRSTKFFTWMMGVIFHQGGTISTVLTGTTVRPVADREKVSHEELSYIVDSTASPIATIIPFNVWPFYIAGLITIDSLATVVTSQESAIGWFMRSIPFNFYGLLAVTFTFLFALDKLPWVGKTMQAAIDRAKSGGGLNRPGASPMLSDELADADVPEGYQPALVDFFVPISVLLGVAIIPWLLFRRLRRRCERHQGRDCRCDNSGACGDVGCCFGFTGRVTFYHRWNVWPVKPGSLHPARHPDAHLHGGFFLDWFVVWHVRGRFSNRTAPRLCHLAGPPVLYPQFRCDHGRSRIRGPVLANFGHDDFVVSCMRC